MTILDVALEYRSANLSVIPIKTDGSKAPDTFSWKQYMDNLPTEQDVRFMFSRDVGVAVLGGAASLNLEVLDFDLRAAFDTWAQACLAEAERQRLTWTILPTVITPDNGVHIYYRHTDRPQGNRKLAWTRDGDVAIETRGCNGYVIAPGSPSACHPSNRPYRLVRGTMTDVPFISAEVRSVFTSVAESMDVKPAQTFAPRYTVSTSPSINGERPGDIYNQRVSWDAILERHGWTFVRSIGDTSYWRRPGKTSGSISATTGHGGRDMVHVFTSNAPPLKPDTGYTKFTALTMLDFHGDFDAAAADCVARGYVLDKPKPLGGSCGSIRQMVSDRLALWP
jgi:hypothetical protein